MLSKSHKDKFTGIYDKNGIPICNGDDVLVHHYNTYPKHPFKCTVIWKHGWELRGKEGDGYDVYAWRKTLEVLNTNKESIFELKKFEELKSKWFNKNVTFLVTGDERKLLHKCFDEAFKIGQELKQEQYDKDSNN